MKQLSLFLTGLVVLFCFAKCTPDNNSQELYTTKEYVQDSSTLVLPVKIDIASFETVFNQQMDKQGWFYEEQGIEVNRNISLSFRVKKEGSAQLYPQDGNIRIQIPLFIDIYPKISGPLSLGLGRDMNLQSKVLLNSTLAVDLDKNWELLTHANSVFEIQEAPKLDIAGFTIDFEKQLNQNLMIGIDEINAQIEQQVKKALNTKEIIELIWKEIKTPYHIESEPFDLWTMVTPNTVTASNLAASGPGVMEIRFKVNTMIDVSSGTRPLRVNTKHIPEATRIKDFPEQNSILHFPLTIPFSTLTDYLNQLEKPISFPIQGKRNLILSNFRATNQNEFIQLNADFISNDTKGVLHLIGEPIFNADSQTISVELQEISTKSNSQVVDQLINSLQKNKSFKKTIEKELRYSIEKDLADLTFTITNQIKTTRFHKYAKLNGYINHIKLQDVYIKNEEILLDTEVNANLVCIVGAGE